VAMAWLDRNRRATAFLKALGPRMDAGARGLRAPRAIREALMSTSWACMAMVATTAISMTTSVAPASAASGPPSTKLQESSRTSGQPLVEPTNLNTDTPPVLRLRLVAQVKQFDIGGKKVRGESYNGH
jgi:hypothetical protein